MDWDRKIKPHNFKAFLLGTFVKFICYNELKRKPKERMRIMKQELLKLRADVGDTDADTPRMKEIMDQYYW